MKTMMSVRAHSEFKFWHTMMDSLPKVEIGRLGKLQLGWNSEVLKPPGGESFPFSYVACDNQCCFYSL